MAQTTDHVVKQTAVHDDGEVHIVKMKIFLIVKLEKFCAEKHFTASFGNQAVFRTHSYKHKQADGNYKSTPHENNWQVNQPCAFWF